MMGGKGCCNLFSKKVQLNEDKIEEKVVDKTICNSDEKNMDDSVKKPYQNSPHLLLVCFVISHAQPIGWSELKSIGWRELYIF